MNKREISEIKKQFKKDNNAITRICGCYVDAEKQIKTTLKEAFFALSEEEIFKYYEIFISRNLESDLNRCFCHCKCIMSPLEVIMT